MKSPMMLVCAMVAAMGMNVLAAEQAPAVAVAKPEVKAEKGKHGPMTEEQREAMMNKQLDAIKEKNPEQYKELVALKEKDLAAFKDKMKELRKAHEAGKGKGKGKGKAAAGEAK